MRVAVTGSSGMLGRALIASLSVPSAANGHRPEVLRLVRRPPTQPDEVWWDPSLQRLDLQRLEGLDAIFHLAGENIGSGDSFLSSITGRWTPRKQHLIIESRRKGTLLLAKAIAALRVKPRVLVSASGLGFYGDHGNDVITEVTPPSTTPSFLADVAKVWEESTAPASAAGVRVVHARLAMVLSASGGALARLHLPFSLGLGGRIGAGTQWVPWIALDDAVRALEHCARDDRVVGAVNVCAPTPCRSSEFTAAVAKCLHRPHLLPLPEFVIRAAFGPMGVETLLVSQRAVPNRLVETGFSFHHADIGDGVEAALHGAARGVA